MILDQVSEQQGVHGKVTGRIHALLHQELTSLARMFQSEIECIKILMKETSLNINFDHVQQSGISLLSDPFFRGILVAFHQYKIGNFLLHNLF